MADNFLEQPDQELKEKLWNEFGLNRERIKEAVENLKDWLKQQPHLPNDLDDFRLERFLLNCKNSMENTKMTLDLHYTLKSITTDFMTGWDPQEDWFHKIFSMVYLYPVRKLTSEGDRIFILGLLTKDATDFDYVSLCKITAMMLEVRTSEDYWRSHIFVIDFKNVTMAHIPKITLTSSRKLEVILIKGYKSRVKSIHLVNVQPFADIVVNIIKSIVRNKIAARLHIHGSDLTEFYKQVPRHLLPSDLGGDEMSIAERNVLSKKKLEDSRDWLLERENMKSDEKKRPGKVLDSGDIFGFEGSFRKLDLD